ncbi:hypothetical protein BH09ACT1_BH09ACT1_12040 [soil metagenome]
MTRTLRAIFVSALALYTIFVLAITLWPQRIDKPIDHQLRTAINTAHDNGAPRNLGYSLIQNVSNGGLFLPLGFLLAVVLVSKRWWISPLACAVLSIGIELCQHFFLPNRLGTVTDVVSNTVGALLGALIALAAKHLASRWSSRNASRASASLQS